MATRAIDGRRGPLPRCGCHRALKLDVRQLEALRALEHFVAASDARNLSSRLINGGSVGNKINNDLNQRLRRLSRPQGLSVLAFACHLLDIDYGPGCRRDTSYQDDLAELLALHDGGTDVSDAALSKGAHSRLFHRAKKRAAGKTWSAVVADLAALRPNLDLRRFFHHAPPGGVPDVDGHLVLRPDLRDDPHVRLRYLHDLVRQRMLAGFPVTLPAFKKSGEVWRYFHRVTTELGLGELATLSAATGLEPSLLTHARSGAKIYAVRHCGRSDESHPRLRSWSEALVDDALAWCIGETYVQAHEHDLTLIEVLGHTPNWKTGPYSGKKPPTVDIAVQRASRCVVEVVNRLDMTREGYGSKLDWKCQQLTLVGVTSIIVRTDGGLDETARSIRRAVTAVAAAVGVDVTNEGILDRMQQIPSYVAGYDPVHAPYYTYAEATARVRELGIRTAQEYRSRNDPRLPSDPSSVYEHHGWIDWFDFLGKPRRGRGSATRRKSRHAKGALPRRSRFGS